MSLTNRIRIELTFGPLTLKELATRCDMKTTEQLHPVIWQMQHRTKEVVAIKGRPVNRYALRSQHTALTEHYK